MLRLTLILVEGTVQARAGQERDNYKNRKYNAPVSARSTFRTFSRHRIIRSNNLKIYNLSFSEGSGVESHDGCKYLQPHFTPKVKKF